MPDSEHNQLRPILDAVKHLATALAFGGAAYGQVPTVASATSAAEATAEIPDGKADVNGVRYHYLLARGGGQTVGCCCVAGRRLRTWGVFVTPQLAVLPNRGTPLPRLPGYLFSAVTDDDLGALLRGAWPLAALAERMRYFIDRFELLGSDNLRSPAALGLRLILVHAFRELALRDPLLPPALLPSDWPGADVRALFARLYLGLSPETDAIIAAQFTDRFGPLHPDLARIEERLNCLRAVTIDGGTVTANCRN